MFVPDRRNSGILMSSVCVVIVPARRNQGVLISSVCIVMLVLVGRGGKGDGCWAGKILGMGQLTLGKRPARMGVLNHVEEAAIPSKRS
jgi:hypothetical protein